MATSFPIDRSYTTHKTYEHDFLSPRERYIQQAELPVIDRKNTVLIADYPVVVVSGSRLGETERRFPILFVCFVKDLDSKSRLLEVILRTRTAGP
jgi:hypothetical protein